ncbi:MAG: hypothetical protein IPL53_23470 [Ignavibacteria bacterium]|nr:hypothetical protein [Ignavibacteria bacterium]
MNLTFTDFQNSPNLKNRILFNGNCSNVKIITNKITGGVTDAGIASSGAEMNGLEIGGNTFSLYRGIHMQEPGVYSVNTKIHDNNFVSNYGISLYRHNSMTIEKNVISLTIPVGTGMYIGDCVNLKIFYNTVKCYSSSSGDVAFRNSTRCKFKK